MPVHNALPFLDAAVESILSQSERDFEFVIFDDGSTDGSLERLRHWAASDNRIRIIHGAENLGPALSSQRVAEEASAPLVARMDADDVSYPERLAEQLRAFRTHPEAGLVASLCDFIDVQGKTLREPEGWRLGRHSAFVPFAHGAIMYRRGLFDLIGGYREQCVFWEDQDLVSRMAAKAPVFVIPRALYQVRLSPTSTRVASNRDQLEHSVDLMFRSVARLQKKQGYDDLLSSYVDNGAKVNPRVFISLGSQMLWAGGKPRLFRRMLERSELRPDLNSMLALIWTGWASISPATLRFFLRMLVHARNSFARPSVLTDGLAVWDPFDRAAGPTASAVPALSAEDASDERPQQNLQRRRRSSQ